MVYLTKRNSFVNSWWEIVESLFTTCSIKRVIAINIKHVDATDDLFEEMLIIKTFEQHQQKCTRL